MNTVKLMIDRVRDGEPPQSVLEDTFDNWKPMDESKQSRSFQHIQERPIGIISAFRGSDERGVPIPLATNLKNSRALKGELRSAGFGPIQVSGTFVENFGTDKATSVREDSYFVPGKPGENRKLKSTLIRLGKNYIQAAVLFKPDDSDEAIVIGTKEGEWPGMGVEVIAGKWKVGSVGQFYSKMRGRGERSFRFESTAQPMGWITRMGLSKEFDRQLQV